jgi:tetratricopeptide (TPR) repeat protein
MVRLDHSKQTALRGTSGSHGLRNGFLWTINFLVAGLLVSGCHNDPNVRKLKYLESGERYSAQGKYNEAIIQFSNALKSDKAYPEAHLGLARAYMHLRRYGAAYSEFERTVSLAPSNCDARLELGSLLLAAGKIDAAQEQATAVLALQPDNPYLHALQAAIYSNRGQKDQALAEIDRALVLDPKRTAFHEERAVIQAGDPNKKGVVEDELKISVELDPKAVNPRLLLATFYAANTRWAEAEQTMRDAVSADPQNIAARQGLAEMFLRQGKQADAEAVLRQAAHDLADDPKGVMILADYYVRSGQPDKARAEFASLAAQHPKNLEVQENYVRSLLQVNDNATARRIVAELMKKNSRNPQVQALNGILLLNEGKPGDAAYGLQNAAKDYPNDAFIQLSLGRAQVAKGDRQAAEAAFLRALDLAPNRLDAAQELARIAGQRGDLNLLGDVAGKAIAAAPRAPEGYVWRATVEAAHNQPDRAEADLKQAMSLAPQSAPAYLQLGKLRIAQKKFPEGVALLSQALQLDPNSVETLWLLVSYDLYQKNPGAALNRVNAQIAISPNNSRLYIALAQLQVEAGNRDAATDAVQKAMQVDPESVEAVLLFVQIQVQRGQVAGAISAWEQWSKSHPNDAGALALLGTLEESRGDTAKAETYYRKALQIKPDQPLAANNLAYAMLENNENLDVALTLAQTARRALPNSPSTADTLAWAYYKKGAYAFARDLLEDALKTNVNDATMQYHLGMVYRKMENKNNAVLHLRKAIAVAPESSSAKDAKVALDGLG